MSSKLLAAVILALTLSACASTQRTLSYQSGWPDADVNVGGYRYQVWFHETDQTMLIQRGDPRPMGQALALNWTRYATDNTQPEIVWRAAADAVLRQIHCEGREVTGQDQIREVSYVCGPGVNVNEAIAANREAWRRGVSVTDPRPR
ncbi:hypothetical protein U91I_00671 [alpha proteobacterium U9-1i]|nr:hypothetical protein U91I_00671 [alpha proteobacterium U9-1i]